MMSDNGSGFPIFLVLWGAMIAVTYYLFFVNKDYETKQKYVKPLVVLGGIAFLAGMLLLGIPRGVVAVFSPIVLLVCYLNTKMFKFCKNCGATVFRQALLVMPKYCPKCGAKLTED
jgi:hypothetical protein